MKNYLIAFGGKARAGKTESSKILQKIVEEDGLVFKKLSFASALKEIAQRYFNWTGDKNIYFQEVEEVVDGYLGPDGKLDRNLSVIEKFQVPIPDKGRQLLIEIGKKFRQIRPSIWADIIYDQIIKEDKANPNDTIFCLDDLRFRNEVDIVKRYGNSTIVRVIRDSQLNINDVSEKDCDDVKFDNIINNNGTLEDLARSISEIYKIAKTGN